MDLVDEFLQRASGEEYSPNEALAWFKAQGVEDSGVDLAEFYLLHKDKDRFRAAVNSVLGTAQSSLSSDTESDSSDNRIETLLQDLAFPTSLKHHDLSAYLKALVEGVGVLTEHRLPSDSRSARKPPRLEKIFVERRGRLSTGDSSSEGRLLLEDGGAFELEGGGAMLLEDSSVREGDFSSLLFENRCAAITAGPGMGKTFFLRHLCHFVTDGSNQRRPSVPILITLRHFVPWFREHKPVESTPETLRTCFWQYLQEEWGDRFPSLPEGIQEWIASPSTEGEKSVTFLFDGLDEVPIEGKLRRHTGEMIEALSSSYGSALFYVSSRVRSYSLNSEARLCDSEGKAWAVCEILPFSPDESRRFVEAWFGEVTQQRWMSESEAITLRDELQEALEKNPALNRIKDSPLMLTMMCIIQSNERKMPKGRGDLYDQLILLLIGEWEDRRAGGAASKSKFRELCERHGELVGTDDVLTAGEIRLALGKMVFELMRSERSGGEKADDLGILIPEQQVSEVLKSLCCVDDPAPDLETCIDKWVTEMMGLIKDHDTLMDRPKGDGSDFVFPHRQYGEFLAGWYVVKHLCQNDPDALRALCDTRIEWVEKWREPILFGVSYLWAKKDDEVSTMKSLIVDLLDGEPRALDLQMAGEMLAEFGESPTLKSKRESVRSQLKSRMLAEDAAFATKDSISDRIDMGISLGAIGDDRKGVACTDDLPDFAWSEPLIPSSEGFLMGSKMGDWGARESEFDQFHCREIEDEYVLSVYPVTVAHYRCFVKAGGYEKVGVEKWWCESGQAWQEKKGIRGPEFSSYKEAFQSGNGPATGVSWYEASAFCQWYTDVSGREIRLPTEAEWEFAARGNHGRIFPWGDEREDILERCNRDSTVSAVGLFAKKGQAIEAKTADQSGNVWEWTNSCWTENYRKNAAEKKALYVIRGGSFIFQSEGGRCAVRGRGNPELRNNNFGFRVLSSSLRNGPEA